MNIIAATLAIRTALLDARKRTGDNTLAPSVEVGYFRVERVTFRADGGSLVKPLTGWLRAGDAVRYIQSL